MAIFICEACGAQLDITGNEAVVTCQYCGTQQVLVNIESLKASTPEQALVQRAFMFLEEGDFERADSYCEQALDRDPTNAKAYLGKLMAELQVCKMQELPLQRNAFDERKNYINAVRYADTALKMTLVGYVEQIKERNYNEYAENRYVQGCMKMNTAKTITEYNKAIDLFAGILSYKDSQQLMDQCKDSVEKLRLEAIRKREEDAKKREESRREQLYNQALSFMAYELSSGALIKAMETFMQIQGWRDVNEKISLCGEKLEALFLKQQQEMKRWLTWGIILLLSPSYPWILILPGVVITGMLTLVITAISPGAGASFEQFVDRFAVGTLSVFFVLSIFMLVWVGLAFVIKVITQKKRIKKDKQKLDELRQKID